MDSSILKIFKYLVDELIGMYQKERGSKFGIINLFGGILYVLWLIGYSLLNELKRLFFWLAASLINSTYSPVPSWLYILLALVIPCYFLLCAYFLPEKIPD